MENKFYTFFIEQTQNGDALAEYSGTTGYASHQLAQVAYFDKLKNVSADIGKAHTYCYAEIRDSFCNRYENNQLGERVMPSPIEED